MPTASGKQIQRALQEKAAELALLLAICIPDLLFPLSLVPSRMLLDIPLSSVVHDQTDG